MFMMMTLNLQLTAIQYLFYMIRETIARGRKEYELHHIIFEP